MKRYSKLLCCVLAGALCVSLTGCQKKEVLDPKNPVTIELWHYYNGPQNVAFEKLVKEFNETEGQTQGIVLEAFSQGNNIEQMIEKVMAAAEKKVGAGDMPDIFTAYADNAVQLDKIGVVAELDSFFTEEELAGYVPGYLEEGRFDGKGTLKIFPTAKSTEVLVLNKTDWDAFAAESGATLEELATIEGLVAVSQRYYQWTDEKTETPEDGKAFFGRDAMANYCFVGLAQMGQPLVSVSEGKPTLNIDEQAFRRLWDCYYVPFIKGQFGAFGKFRSDDAKTGDIIALVGSTSAAAYFPTQVVDAQGASYPIEALVLPPPLFAGGQAVAIQQGAGMVIAKSDPKKEYAATQFLKWFTEEERNLQFSANSGYLPVKSAGNSPEQLQQVIAQRTEPLALALSGALQVGMEIAKSHIMFTSPVYDGSNNLRVLLDEALEKKAKTDREAVLEAVQGGSSLLDATAPYLTEENFIGWFNDTSKALKETL